MTAPFPERRSRLPSRWMVAMCLLRFVCLAEDVLPPAGLLSRIRGSTEADTAGADELFQPVRAHELLERVDLLGMADDLEDDRVGAEIRDACVEGLGQRYQLSALGRTCGDLEQGELSLDRLARLELAHPEHVDELVHLLLDLLERMLLAVHAERDARHVVARGRTVREALDVEAAPREHARYAH